MKKSFYFIRGLIGIIVIFLVLSSFCSCKKDLSTSVWGDGTDTSAVEGAETISSPESKEITATETEGIVTAGTATSASPETAELMETEGIVTAETATSASPETAEVVETETAASPAEPSNALPLGKEAVELVFSSGAGGWSTVLTLNPDGTFQGQYYDNEFSEIGEGYPKGSVYLSVFKGEFTDIKAADEYSYEMTLSSLTTERADGETWIEDGIKYNAVGANGLIGGNKFILYLPETPTEIVPEELLWWRPMIYFPSVGEAPRQLSGYTLYNTSTGDGFFE